MTKERSGLNFHVYRTGSRTGTVFVLLHGIGVSHRYFRRLSKRLAAVGGTVAFDLPGFGGTATPAVAVSVERYARAIGSALDVLGCRDCVIIGQSMGAQFGVELAVQRPDLVSHLILIGPVVDSERRTLIEQCAALARDTMAEPASANAIVLTDYLRCGPRWYLTELRQMLRYPIEQRTAAVSQPVLVLRGRSDPIAGEEWCRRLAQTAPSGSFVEIAGRHLVQHSAAHAVFEAIGTFVAAQREKYPR